MNRTPDFLIIGGGVMGLALALEARRRHPAAAVLVLEKERACGAHATGRNSGVLHAGFYYEADSLKARFCRDGNRRLTELCQEHGIAVRRCGKLVVARDAADLPVLDELERRGRANGIALERVTEAGARELEPRARTHAFALFSPTTSSVDPAAVMRALQELAEHAGIEIATGTRYLGRTGARVRTSAGTLSPGFVINAAGVYADRVARDFGFGAEYVILPFKGVYLYADEGTEPLRLHVYPVPDLGYPFLGVHFTVTAQGRVKIGPTAMPALWREDYRGLANFRLGEALEIVAREAVLLARDDFGFRGLALRELRRYRRRTLVAQAAVLVPDVRPASFRHWGVPGVRAQLLHLRSRRLEMDFVVQGDERSLHVLNAVSPAFTCALPFAEHVLERAGLSAQPAP